MDADELLKTRNRLVHLIAGLRQHQVEEAVDLLLALVLKAQAGQLPHPESAAGTPQPVTLEQVRELLQDQRQQLLQELRQVGAL